MRRKISSGLIVSSLLALPEASAQSSYSLFGGLSGGYTHIDPGQGTAKNGYHLLASAFIERQAQGSDWIAELGGGFFYNKVYSDGEKDFPGSQPTSVREQRALRIETRAGAMEGALRQRWGLGLEGGLLLRALFGSSLAFSQDQSSRHTKFFLGPQVVLRLGEFAGYQHRLDMSLSVSLNVPDKKVYLLTAGYAIGGSLQRPEAPLPSPPAEDRWEEVFADKVINFPTASATVQGPARGFLSELGTYLRAETSAWSAMEIQGHTDKKGRRAYNLTLSQQRADAVRAVLLEAGVPADRVSARGYGPDQPLIAGESPEALAANRRVVMIFTIQGRQQRSELGAEIMRLRQKYFGE